MQFAAAGDLEVVRAVGLFDPQGNVGVQLAHQTVAQVAGGHVFALLPCERAVIHEEMHRDGRFGDLLEGDGRRRQRIAERIADVDALNARDCHDGAHVRFRDRHLGKPVEFEQAADLHLQLLFRRVVVHDHHFLVHAELSVIDLADADAADVFVIVDGGNEKLQRGVRITFGCWDRFEDGIEERPHVDALVAQILHRPAVARGREDEGAVQLLLGSIQFQQQVQDLIHHFFGTGFRTVDLVDADDHVQVQFQCLGKHEAGLRHGAFESVHHEDDTVHHLQDALHLAAEIGVAGSIHDVDLHTLVGDSGVLRQDGDPALALQVARVHDALGHFLVLAEHAALLQELVHQGRLAVVDVGNYCNISDIFSDHK